MTVTGPAAATIGGHPVPVVPDLVRMRAARQARLQAAMEAEELAGLVLLNTGAVAYATGARTPGTDPGRAGLFRSVAVVVRGQAAPHLYTGVPDGAPPELPAEHVHGPLFPDLEEGIDELASALSELLGPGGRVGIDEHTHPMLRHVDGYQWVDASVALGAAKLCKAPDEIACIRIAQRINELAMAETQAALRPGIRQSDLTAVFLRRAFELGADANLIDPIWQVMEPTRAMGPWTVHGGLAFPTASSDRFLREGDVVWNDSGLEYAGYASDFGRTWIVSRDPQPTERQRAQYRRWREVVDAVLAVTKPGATGLELARAAVAANGGRRPWIEHFYLAHGVGTDSAEMPLVGTDLGESFDEQLVLAPGAVLVLEPVIWDEGAAGYRAEDIVAVTDDGWMPLSDYPYAPYEPSADWP